MFLIFDCVLTDCVFRSTYSVEGQSLVGVRAGSVGQPQLQPVARAVGGPGERRLPVRAVGEGGETLGREEEQQQNDVRETQPGDEVSFRSKLAQAHYKNSDVDFTDLILIRFCFTW